MARYTFSALTSLDEYTGDEPAELYKALNDGMRRAVTAPAVERAELIQDWQPLAGWLLSALAKLPSSGLITVWRGVTGVDIDAMAASYIPGRVVQWTSFSSSRLKLVYASCPSSHKLCMGHAGFNRHTRGSGNSRGAKLTDTVRRGDLHE